MPSRTQSRQSILEAASPSTLADESGVEIGMEPDQTSVAATPRSQPLQTSEPSAIEQQAEGYVLPENSAEQPIDVDEFEARVNDPNEQVGIRLGTVTLRPSISQSINSEREKQGDTSSSRSYLTTTARGTLDSDWSRHALRIEGEGRFERNISGHDLSEQPETNINADLRLDLSDDLEAHILGGYRSEKEDVDSPNAIGGIASQGTEHRVNVGATIARELGTLRALAGVDFSRTSYSNAENFDGTSISLDERNRNEVTLRSRVGYALSPALIPFLELQGATTQYDDQFDSSGYQRSSRTIGAKIGAEFDRGQKLSGEFALGYLTRSYDDSRLNNVGAVSVDASANWSPKRGTDINFTLRTSLDDFSSGSESGWANYFAQTSLTHQIRSDLAARLSAQAEYRDAQDVTEYMVGAGLTWKVNRFLDATADASYKFTPRYNSSDLIVGAGLTLKR